MKPSKYFIVKQILGTSAFLLALLAITSSSMAGYMASSRSRPPRTPPILGATQGEDCSSSSDNPFKVLAPRYYIGQTASPRPTLAWDIPFSERHPLELKLYKHDGQRFQLQPAYTKLIDTSQGIMTWTLPDDLPELVVGETYEWVISVQCDPDNLSNSLVSNAEFEVMPTSSNFRTQIATISNPIERAKFYAQTGFWYDAFAQVANASASEAEQLRQSLLNELEESEKPYQLRQRIMQQNQTTHANPQSR